MKPSKVIAVMCVINFLHVPLAAYAEPPADIQNLIQKRDVALKNCMNGYEAASYETGYMESNSICKSAKQLESEINQQGWCWRYPFAGESNQDVYMSCDTINDVTAILDVDGSRDRPETSSLEAEWLLPLDNYHKDAVRRENIGFLSITCNDTDGARTMLSVTDEASGLSGLPFKSELQIGYVVKASSPIILPAQTSRKTVVFGNENTLQILRWVNDSVEDSDSMNFIARENSTNSQLRISISNFTSQYDENGPVAKRWAAHMHSMCESFSRKATRR